MGWPGDVMLPGELAVPGHPTNLDSRRARAYYPCSRCGWGLFGHFFSLSIFSHFFLPLWEMARYRLKYCLKGLLDPKQPANQTQFRVYKVINPTALRKAKTLKILAFVSAIGLI